jgi:hypothetical protein
MNKFVDLPGYLPLDFFLKVEKNKPLYYISNCSRVFGLTKHNSLLLMVCKAGEDLLLLIAT